jgi:hypothetical protein
MYQSDAVMTTFQLFMMEQERDTRADASLTSSLVTDELAIANDDIPDCTEEECAICYCSNFVCKVRLKCNHVFHAHCIERWKRMKESCPTCRAALVIKSLVQCGRALQDSLQLARHCEGWLDNFENTTLQAILSDSHDETDDDAKDDVSTGSDVHQVGIDHDEDHGAFVQMAQLCSELIDRWILQNLVLQWQ